MINDLFPRKKILKLKAFRKHFGSNSTFVQILVSTAAAAFLHTAANAADHTKDHGNNANDEYYPSPSSNWAIAYFSLLNLAFLEKIAIILALTFFGEMIVNCVFAVVESFIDIIWSASNLIYETANTFLFWKPLIVNYFQKNFLSDKFFETNLKYTKY